MKKNIILLLVFPVVEYLLVLKVLIYPVLILHSLKPGGKNTKSTEPLLAVPKLSEVEFWLQYY